MGNELVSQLGHTLARQSGEFNRWTGFARMVGSIAFRIDLPHPRWSLPFVPKPQDKIGQIRLLTRTIDTNSLNSVVARSAKTRRIDKGERNAAK